MSLEVILFVNCLQTGEPPRMPVPVTTFLLDVADAASDETSFASGRRAQEPRLQRARIPELHESTRYAQWRMYTFQYIECFISSHNLHNAHRLITFE